MIANRRPNFAPNAAGQSPYPATALPLLPPAFSSQPAPVRLAEVLSALTYAMDLTEGHPAGHTLGTTLIGTRLGTATGLNASEQSALYYTLLLKDVGCSSNAARIALLFGSQDQVVKHRMKFVDWQHRMPLAFHTALSVGMGKGLLVRLQHFALIARTADVTRELIELRCERGADIALELGFPGTAAEAIRALDEHWNGQGYPSNKKGTAIPHIARIANLAQCVQLFYTAYGLKSALKMARSRRGTWFDPQLVDLLLSWQHDADWWQTLRGPDLGAAVVAAEPVLTERLVNNVDLDSIAHAFSEIIDAKSPFTFKHSVNVASYARGMATLLGHDPASAHRLYRAALVHDIGKLGVSNRILDKNGSLSPDERRTMELHPVYTWEILARVPAFSEFARLAAVHHEKLDGTGYPWKLTGQDLDLDARILTVADMFDALISDRPYRKGMQLEQALAILQRQTDSRLDPLVVETLIRFLSGSPAVPAVDAWAHR
ncbi:MAG: HD domain-containing protein [Herpetosiphon sp.]